ncbi:hypothetical protein SAY87_028870 [Trapa incisa]|uniref:Uncharacterized protein n=1 Tax=Trapa incisa TaxID=236973 RepID=A0AAN7QQH9_9MYRT|nr:hypothetical protein SAY87_028870 [Trapa incisa]
MCLQIQEVVPNGKLSKLEHFERDKKVEEMEKFLQKAGEEILRGKASYGDMDVVITHPDGKSHGGFLKKYVKYLKEALTARSALTQGLIHILVFTHPGRELCHHIDFKVYLRDIYAFGPVAWTGNDVLNRSSNAKALSSQQNSFLRSLLAISRRPFGCSPALAITASESHVCRAAEYRFPDPIPEFADAETEKFRTHLEKKLSKKDIFGDSTQDVVGICTEIFNTFLHSEYGGPGTLLVSPFIDMADTINERGLPGGPQAARAAVKWAQAHVDKDWKDWNGDESS